MNMLRKARQRWKLRIMRAAIGIAWRSFWRAIGWFAGKSIMGR